jgi:hypothetical protein
MCARPEARQPGGRAAKAWLLSLVFFVDRAPIYLEGWLEGWFESWV